jgi:hypothetical protein
MKKLASNTELYEYLLSLGNLLADRGSQHLADLVRFAARQAAGLSTEFLGESRISLRGVLDAENGVLHADERDEVLSVVSQIEFVLRR